MMNGWSRNLAACLCFLALAAAPARADGPLCRAVNDAEATWADLRRAAAQKSSEATGSMLRVARAQLGRNLEMSAALGGVADELRRVLGAPGQAPDPRAASAIDCIGAGLQFIEGARRHLGQANAFIDSRQGPDVLDQCGAAGFGNIGRGGGPTRENNAACAEQARHALQEFRIFREKIGLLQAAWPRLLTCVGDPNAFPGVPPRFREVRARLADSWCSSPGSCGPADVNDLLRRGADFAETLRVLEGAIPQPVTLSVSESLAALARSAERLPLSGNDQGNFPDFLENSYRTVERMSGAGDTMAAWAGQVCRIR